MYEFKVNRKNFKVDVDFKELIREATSYKDNSEMTTIDIVTEKPVTKEMFEDDVQMLINYIKTLDSNPELLDPMVIYKMDKKKDGWLAKGRISILVQCEKTAYIVEDEYGYRCYCLKAKSISADTIKVFLTEEIFKW